MVMKESEPYHEGERHIQLKVGERDAARRNAGNVADAIPPAARNFVLQQHYALLGWRDPNGALWASFLAGSKGFASSDESGRQLRFALDDPADVLSRVPPLNEIAEGDHLGALFIELATRRRLRVNGCVAEMGPDHLSLDIDAAYPLCPKYIQRRKLAETDGRAPDPKIERGSALTGEFEGWIATADTFFVASAHPDGPADVSHRGGPPGFVRVERGVLIVPDYPGNSMFNTLGNLALNPRAGLVFVDFVADRQLQLTGQVELDLDAGDDRGATGGTGRWWRFHPERWIVSSVNRSFAWQYIDASPFNP